MVVASSSYLMYVLLWRMLIKGPWVHIELTYLVWTLPRKVYKRVVLSHQLPTVSPSFLYIAKLMFNEEGPMYLELYLTTMQVCYLTGIRIEPLIPVVKYSKRNNETIYELYIFVWLLYNGVKSDSPCITKNTSK